MAHLPSDRSVKWVLAWNPPGSRKLMPGNFPDRIPGGREGHGKLLQPCINIPSTTVQKFSHEKSMSHNWPPETIMSGKFLAQKILFDHPSVYSWATNLLARFYTIIHLRPLVGMHSLVIEAEELLADAIFAAKRNLPTNNLSVHGLALNISCALSHFCINARQSLSTRGTHPTIERNIRFLTTSRF